ncbi:MAG: hypothetical protein K2Q21_03975 [Chitinophagaceae bacterium]|nr:hypothetical protein [Chitinophagaceae bacterium]
MKHLSVIIGLAGFLFIGAIGHCQNRISVTAGQKIQQTTNQNSTIVQTVQGNEMEITSNVKLAVDLEVKKSSPNIELSNTVTRLQLHTEAMGNSTDFDSDKQEDKDGQIGQMLKGVIGKPFEVSMSVDGIVFKSDKDKSEKEAASNILGGNIDDVAKESFLAIPASIKVGDSLVVVGDITDKDNSKTITYSVESITGNDAVLTFKGSETSKKTKSMQNMEAVVTSTSTSSGTVIVDTKSGLIKEKKSTIEAKGTTEVMGQSIPFSLKQTVVTNNK